MFGVALAPLAFSVPALFTGAVPGPAISDTRGQRIYVANPSDGTVRTYLPNGLETFPIIVGLRGTKALAVDKNGSIYETDGTSVAVYLADGTPSLSITQDLCQANGIAVDSLLKIWVTNACGKVDIFNPDGSVFKQISQVNLTSLGVAIDKFDKAYVSYIDFSEDGYVYTYRNEGHLTQPMIEGLDFPGAIAVDAAGKIYVANNQINVITSYLPDGSQTSPTIQLTTGVPAGLALNASGSDLYVADGSGNAVVTFRTKTGKQASPTIRGLRSPLGVAFH